MIYTNENPDMLSAVEASSSVCDLSPADALPVGMSYTPVQKFRDLYSEEDALKKGTLFEKLYLPFGGKCV